MLALGVADVKMHVLTSNKLYSNVKRSIVVQHGLLFEVYDWSLINNRMQPHYTNIYIYIYQTSVVFSSWLKLTNVLLECCKVFHFQAADLRSESPRWTRWFRSMAWNDQTQVPAACRGILGLVLCSEASLTGVEGWRCNIVQITQASFEEFL